MRNGTIQSSGNSTADDDSKIWIQGTVRLTGGSGFMWDFDHRTNHTTSEQDADLRLVNSKSSGTRNSMDTLSTLLDTIVYHTIDLAGVKLHAKVIGFQHGTVNTTDRIMGTLTQDELDATRTFSTIQDGLSTNFVRPTEGYLTPTVTEETGPTRTMDGPPPITR